MPNESLNLLFEIGKTALLPLFAYLATVLIDKIKKKIAAEEKKAKLEMANHYMMQLDQTIETCVRATNQTYVNIMKETNAFDKTAREAAMKKTFDAVKATLSVDAIEHLALLTSDLDTLITNKIEAVINSLK